MDTHPESFIEEIDAQEMELKDPVGKGSFGVVYMALWRGTHVAVKMIDSESERIAFMTELRQLSRVSHHNIIRLYGACRQPVSLVMEFAECGSLYNLLHGPGLQPHYSTGHAMSWCLQCAAGVAYLHAMKPKPIIHRDLKPPNLLLTNMGAVLKICDFGTACDQHTYMTNNKGSAAWMAPEVFEGCQYSEKCDVFSWAIILWEVLTRRKPFDELGGPAFRIMWAVHSGTRPSLIKNCPFPIEFLMTRCWSPVPEKRPSMDQIVDEMTHLLQFFPGGKTPLVFPAFSDNDSSLASSGTSSSYDLTNTDRSELHMTAITETMRKPLSNHMYKVLSNQQQSRYDDIQYYKAGCRTRSRSHTPEPIYKSRQDETKQLASAATPIGMRFKKTHRRSSSYGNTLRVPLDCFKLAALGEEKKDCSRRKSSADLIAELEQQPIESSTKTPISSRSASPVTSKLTTNKRVVYQQKQTIVSPSLQNTRISSSPNDLISYESLPRAYITLELHLQPLPPSTSSHQSMQIYEKHCLLAEEYLRMETEIKSWEKRALQLRYELQREEENENEEIRLQNEYQQLLARNKSLRKWKEKMNNDLRTVRGQNYI